MVNVRSASVRDPVALRSEFDRLATIYGGWLRWRRTGRPVAERRVRAAWEEHERFDRLPTLPEARRQAASLLPGAQVRHHLLWRYSIRWQHGADGGVRT